MKVLNLRCGQDHRFEGWFASDAEQQRQLAQGLLTCPLCGDAEVVTLPSAPHVQVTKAVAPHDPLSLPSAGVASPPEAATPATLQTVWMKAVAHVLANTEDVGDRFAAEARRIHQGEAQERGIRGQATRDERQALQEEGIEVVALPLPAALKGTLQ
ncbi:MAG: DUF1178 family protein [Pseudomonadota bacterium]